MRFKKTISAAFIFFTCAIISYAHLTNAEESSDFIPSNMPLIHRKSYVLSYDGKTRNAHWVYQKLTVASLEGTANRSHFDFLEDPLIPFLHRATKKDYKDSGFDRGHLCPAADARANSEAIKDTFYLSNISPQTPELNRKLWLKLERHARDLTKTHETIEVISGPLYLPKKDKTGKRYVTYQVIGENDIAVPTHFFKVIRCLNAKTVKIEAYIIPNEPFLSDSPLEEFMVTLEKVEKAAGIIIKTNYP